MDNEVVPVVPTRTLASQLLRSCLEVCAQGAERLKERLDNRMVIDRREVLRSALVFYASPENWQPTVVPDDQLPPEAMSYLESKRQGFNEDGWLVAMCPGAALDGGDHARWALQIASADHDLEEFSSGSER